MKKLKTEPGAADQAALFSCGDFNSVETGGLVLSRGCAPELEMSMSSCERNLVTRSRTTVTPNTLPALNTLDFALVQTDNSARILARAECHPN